MSKTTVAIEGVFVVGNFFNGTPEPLDDNGDGTWTFPGRFTKGDTLFYKFINGQAPEALETDAGCLANDGSGNRMFIVPSEETALHKSCYNACETCENLSTSITNFNTPIDITVFPNPITAAGKVVWKGTENTTVYEVRLIEMSGKVLQSYSNITNKSLLIRKEGLFSGMYFLQIISKNGGSGGHKIVVR